MGFLMQKEVSNFKQDIKNGSAKQIAEKEAFKKKILDGMGEEMKKALEHPDKKKEIKFAKKYSRKKRWTIWKENFKRIFEGNKKKEVN